MFYHIFTWQGTIICAGICLHFIIKVVGTTQRGVVVVVVGDEAWHCQGQCEGGSCCRQQCGWCGRVVVVARKFGDDKGRNKMTHEMGLPLSGPGNLSLVISFLPTIVDHIHCGPHPSGEGRGTEGTTQARVW